MSMVEFCRGVDRVKTKVRTGRGGKSHDWHHQLHRFTGDRDYIICTHLAMVPRYLCIYCRSLLSASIFKYYRLDMLNEIVSVNAKSLLAMAAGPVGQRAMSSRDPQLDVICALATSLAGSPCYFIHNTDAKPLSGGEYTIYALESSDEIRLAMRIPKDGTNTHDFASVWIASGYLSFNHFCPAATLQRTCSVRYS